MVHERAGPRFIFTHSVNIWEYQPLNEKKLFGYKISLHWDQFVSDLKYELKPRIGLNLQKNAKISTLKVKEFLRLFIVFAIIVTLTIRYRFFHRLKSRTQMK